MNFEEFKKYHNANHHDGDSHFDERIYKKSNGDDFDYDFVQTCFDHFEAGAASRQAEIDDLLELNRLYKIALQQSVNRTSSFVHEKIISLESKIKGQNNG